MPLLRESGRSGESPDALGRPAGRGPLTLPAVLVLALVAVIAVRPPWWSFNYAAVLALIALALTGRAPRLRLPDTLALATGAWALAGPLWAGQAAWTLPGGYRYATVCLVFVTCRQVIRSRRDLLLLGWAYLGACVVVALEVLAGARDELRQQGELVDVATRYGVEGREINATAYTLAVGTVVAILLTVAAGRHPLLRFGPPLLALPVTWAMLLTGCRGAAIGVLVGVVVLALAWRLPWATAAGIGITSLLLLVVVPVGVAPEGAMRWLDQLYDRPTGDISGRLELWPYALSTWGESPLTGSGPGVFTHSNPMEIGPHNLLLILGNDLGLVGVLLYLGTIAAACWTTARSGRRGLVLACVLTGVLLPIWLTGQWETALAMWLALALVTVLPELPVAARPMHRAAPGTSSWGSRPVTARPAPHHVG
ncbi:O-antigen ligase family protein [Micromonospora sp. NPDC051296]|uniref:O-antigen ligase family protein n=1 Tax=Micromonospora sp. NPDC051296 TaxID=3155046 RepID=UPI0034335C5F